MTHDEQIAEWKAEEEIWKETERQLLARIDAACLLLGLMFSRWRCEICKRRLSSVYPLEERCSECSDDRAAYLKIMRAI